MDLYFTEDEMTEYLLARGYVIMTAVEEVEVNTYQNVFLRERIEVITVFKENDSFTLKNAFDKELKKHLLNK